MTAPNDAAAVTVTSPANQVHLTERQATPYESQRIERADAASWKQLGINIQRGFADPENSWQVTAGNLVGIAEIGDPTSPLTVRIGPKMEADLFMLADWAFSRRGEQAPQSALTAHLDVMRREPVACILAWYLQALEQFAIRWLRRDVRLREDVLIGRVRGQMMMNDYVRRSVSAARPHHVPCRFLDTTRDTLPNRILLRALRSVAALIPTLEIADARQHLRSTVSRIEPLFAGVADQTVSAGDFARIRYAGAQRHYQSIITKSQAILGGMFYTDTVGQHQQRAFIWEAPRLFQEALRGLLESSELADLDTTRHKVSVDRGDGVARAGSKVDPDYVLKRAGQTLLLDAKWKEVGQRAASREPEEDVDLGEVAAGFKIKVSRPDVYQAVSYSQFDKYRPATTGLVYPIVLKAGAQLPKPMTISGFGKPVWILFIDVGVHARTHRSTFFENLAIAWGI